MNFKLKLNYYTNFSPRLKKQKDKFKNKIFLRSFFLLIFILKAKGGFQNVTIFIKPNQNRDLVLLRAPYRYKLAKLQITIKRYNIQIILCKNNHEVSPLTFFKKQKFYISKFISRLETFFLHQHKSTFYVDVKNKKNFLLKNF